MLDGLRAHVRVPVTVTQDPARMRPADTPIVLGDRSLLTADTGWEPAYPLATTLADLVEYWREQARTDVG
jgi:GDP-4-dehydro-6-deoxy-D-mannose reductase